MAAAATRALIPDNAFGVNMLKWLFAAEDRFPRLALRLAAIR
jgi:hypothetical protein